MDVHVRIAIAGWLIVAALPCSAAAEDDPPPAAGAALWELQGTDGASLGLEGSAIADLDALLADPVDLASGEAERLTALPWLARAQIDSLAAHPGVGSADEIAALPGWDAASARSLVPFVRFAHRRPSLPLQARMHVSPGSVRIEASLPGLQFSARRPQADAKPGGTLCGRYRGLGATAGDFRCGVSQGLAIWGESGGPRLDAPLVRRSRGIVSSGDPGAARALRGLAIEWYRDRCRVLVLSAHSAAGRTQVVSAAGPVGQGELRTTLTIVGTRRVASLGYEEARLHHALAVEIAAENRRRASFAGGAEFRAGRFIAGAQVGVAPAGPLDALATGTVSIHARHGLVRLRARLARARLETTLLCRAEEALDGSWSTRDDAEVRFAGSWANTSFDFRLRRTREANEGWVDPAHRFSRAEERVALRLRARRAVFAGWVMAVGVQRNTTAAPGSVSAGGEAWEVSCERVTGRCRPAASLGMHHVPSGVEIWETLPGASIGARRANGEALCGSLGLGIRGGPLVASGSVTASAALQDGVRVRANGALTLRLP